MIRVGGVAADPPDAPVATRCETQAVVCTIVAPSEKSPRLARIARAAFGATLVVGALLVWIGLPLETEQAPLGIVSFELARTPEAMRSIVASWDANARERATLSLIVDYPFLIAYAAFLWAALKRAALRTRSTALMRLARAMWLAAGLDAIENAALALILAREGATGALVPMLAFGCASLKFVLVVVALLVLPIAMFRSRARVPESDQS